MSPTATKPRVLVTRKYPSAVMARLEAACDVELYRPSTALAAMTAEELRARIGDKQGLLSAITDRVDGTLLDGAPELRIIANFGVGYDHIDAAAAKARGVIVTNTPDVLTDATAELTWALILDAARRVTEGDRLVRRGGWTGWAPDFMLGTELRGKRLGIIGSGRIGRAVAAKAPAFGMDAVFARRPKQHADAAKTSMSLDELLVSADVVSIHVPGGASTRQLIDRRTLARMKRTAILVNTSRGSVVDEEGLAWALKEGLIAAAGLDVYEREPQVHDALLDLENVVLAPHLGSATRETRTAMAELAASNLIAVLSGNPPLTPV